MQQVLLNVNESVLDKFMWLLQHFNKNEVEVLDFDSELESEIQKGFDSPVSPLSSKEVFEGLRAKYTQK